MNLHPRAHPLPPVPHPLAWPDRASLLTTRAAAVAQLTRGALRLRDLGWAGLTTLAVSASWLILTETVTWLGNLGDLGDLGAPDSPDAVEWGVGTTAAALALAVTGLSLAGFARVLRRGRLTRRLLAEWTALDRDPAARSLPPGAIPEELASPWDLLRAGRPWRDKAAVYHQGRGHLVHVSGAVVAWLTLPSAPLMFGLVAVAAAVPSGYPSALVLAGLGVTFTVVGGWALGTGIRHWFWAVREARARVREERRWGETGTPATT
ncbi:hypothetical protein [Streptomyces sp. NPDC059009]|uniref:hypothetical protein n=1 Tax=Streptomyces sp. NPDC059009 TaxID=3346694 RepID=UPI0036CFFFCA